MTTYSNAAAYMSVNGELTDPYCRTMTGSFGLLSEDDDLAHYGDELRDRRDSEVTL